MWLLSSTACETASSRAPPPLLRLRSTMISTTTTTTTAATAAAANTTTTTFPTATYTVEVLSYCKNTSVWCHRPTTHTTARTTICLLHRQNARACLASVAGLVQLSTELTRRGHRGMHAVVAVQDTTTPRLNEIH